MLKVQNFKVRLVKAKRNATHYLTVTKLDDQTISLFSTLCSHSLAYYEPLAFIVYPNLSRSIELRTEVF